MQWLRVSIVSVLMLGLSASGGAEPPRHPAQAVQAAPAAQTAPDAEPQQPVFRTGINFVRVDVIVTDRDGNPVTDLSADEFEVFEDGEPQVVETFQLFQFGATPPPGAEPPQPIRNAFDEEREAARPDVRLFAIFLDEYHVRRGTSLRVHEPLAEFIRTQLAPTDMVAIMYPLTPLGSVRMTRNHKAVIAEVKRFIGRKYNYTPRNAFEMRYSQYPSEIVEQVRNQVSLTALRALVTHLGGLREGRKSVILVSEGYTNRLPPQLRRSVASELPDPRVLNPAYDNVDPLESARRIIADMNIQEDLRRVFDTANRANTSIYALDPRGLASFEFDIDTGVGFAADRDLLRSTADTLRELADQTDGRAIVNQNDLAKGLRQVIRDSNAYYLLGYNSSLAPTDGEFHAIKVRVKRRGVHVRARKGYWALSPEDALRVAKPPAPKPPSEAQLALSLLSARRTARIIQTWLGMARGANGRTRLTFVWSRAPRVPGQRRDEAQRVSVVASGGGGTYFRGHVPEDPRARTGRSRSRGRRQVGPEQVVFEVDPGPVELHLSVEGAAGRILDTNVLEFDAPDFTNGVALSSPVVLRARNAYERRQLLASTDPVPETSREFRRSDRLVIRFEVYGGGTAAPAVAARLLNRAGEPMTDVPVTPPAAAAPYVLDLPLAGLAPGEYLVEITGTVGADTAHRLIALRVTS